MSFCMLCSHQTVGARRGELDILECTNSDCGHISLDTDKFVYPYSHTDYYDHIEKSDIVPDKPFISGRVRVITDITAKKGRLAELGCGLGETAINFQRQHFEVWGVEESRNAISFLKGNYPEVNWQCNNITDFLKESPKFDVITLFHVLEHVLNPKEIVGLIKERVVPGGLVLIEVPDVHGGLARLKGNKWEFWLSHHVQYFSRISLSRLMESLGFSLVYSQKMYHLGYPQGRLCRDVIHGTLANIGLNSILRTVWQNQQ